MESDSPDPLPVFLASPPGSAATFDRPEGRLDQSESVAPFRPLSMILRSHSQAGRSKSPVPEKLGGAIRTESEHLQPETEDALCAGRAMRKIPDSPDIDSSGETGKTPSGPILPSRQEPEPEIAVCPPVHLPSSTSPPGTTPGFFNIQQWRIYNNHKLDMTATWVCVAVLQLHITCHNVSFTMHGFNQGSHTVRDLVLSRQPDIFPLQEHWLTPANLDKLQELSPSTYVFVHQLCAPLLNLV